QRPAGPAQLHSSPTRRSSDQEDSGNYRINPKNDRNHMDGVSTADLVRIQKHILGLTPITNPYALIAADINKSNSISAKDLVALRSEEHTSELQSRENLVCRLL